jgi:hypothetical protein
MVSLDMNDTLVSEGIADHIDTDSKQSSETIMTINSVYPFPWNGRREEMLPWLGSLGSYTTHIPNLQSLHYAAQKLTPCTEAMEHQVHCFHAGRLLQRET